jgi:hypothetical protein
LVRGRIKESGVLQDVLNEMLKYTVKRGGYLGLKLTPAQRNAVVLVNCQTEDWTLLQRVVYWLSEILKAGPFLQSCVRIYSANFISTPDPGFSLTFLPIPDKDYMLR